MNDVGVDLYIFNTVILTCNLKGEGRHILTGDLAYLCWYCATKLILGSIYTFSRSRNSKKQFEYCDLDCCP